MNDNSIVYISEENVRRLLSWGETFKAVEAALEGVTRGRAIQNPRSFTKALNSECLLLTMPGYLDSANFTALACKLVTASPSNPKLEKPLPTIMANIALFDECTGALKAIVSGTEITKWRTAAASIVASKHIKPNVNFKVLAVLGAGAQARIHALAFQHFFRLNEIRIWNHNLERAERLADELRSCAPAIRVRAVPSNEECVRGADVVVTATNATTPIVNLEWLEAGTHINAIGAGITHHSELAPQIYAEAAVFVDHIDGARRELARLEAAGVTFRGQVGDLIAGAQAAPPLNAITVFQSLGMAVEDCAMARLIFDLYQTQQRQSSESTN